MRRGSHAVVFRDVGPQDAAIAVDEQARGAGDIGAVHGVAALVQQAERGDKGGVGIAEQGVGEVERPLRFLQLNGVVDGQRGDGNVGTFKLILDGLELDQLVFAECSPMTAKNHQ